MSGWIKLEKDRRDDPRVLRMARELRHAGVTHERFTQNAHVTLVLGCLDQIWCYADTHIREDDTLDLGVDEIDELVGLQGFCSLMPSDWLEVLDANRVKLPGFHEHNGTESKRKALSQKRSERYRNATALQEVTQASRSSVTRALPDQTRPDLDQTKTPQESARPAARDGGPRGTDAEALLAEVAPDRASVVLHDSLPTEEWQQWLGHRRKRRWPLDATTLRKQLATLAAYDAPTQREMIDQAINAGWQGIFPPKGGKPKRAYVPPKSVAELEAEEAARATG